MKLTFLVTKVEYTVNGRAVLHTGTKDERKTRYLRSKWRRFTNPAGADAELYEGGG